MTETPPAGAAIEITPALWRVGGDSWNGTVTGVSPTGDANVYVLFGSEAPALIDCATLFGKECIERNLRQAGVEPGELGQLLLTHSHWDHTEATHSWQETYELETLLGAVGANYLERGDWRLSGAPLHGPEYRIEPFVVDRPVADQDTVEVAGYSMRADSMPGHTPDSMLYTFDLDGRQAAICGDIVFGLSETKTYSLGLLCGLWGSNLDQYVASLRRLAAMSIDLLIPGHGEVVVGPGAVAEAIAGTLKVAERLASDPAVRRNTDF